MADPSNDEKFDKGKEKEVIAHKPGHRREHGRQNDQTGECSGTPLSQGAEFGGEVDEPASYGAGIAERQSIIEGEGFILQRDSGSDDLQRPKSPSSAQATGGTDFAREGRGKAEDEDEDMSEGHPS